MNTQEHTHHHGHDDHVHHDHAHMAAGSNHYQKSAESAPVSAPPVTYARGKVEYTCPMHPEIVRDAPGSCPICGMALEPRTIRLSDEENPELTDMRRRFWVSV